MENTTEFQWESAAHTDVGLARARNEADRRSSVLSLTDAGWAIYRKVEPVALAAENALIEDLDAADLARIGKLLAHLKRRARAIGEV